MAKLPTLGELHAEIAQLRKRYALPSDDQAFVLWYCSTALTGDDEKAKACLLGGSGDVNTDALYIDDRAQIAFLVQAKYRSSEKASEGRNDLTALGSLGGNLLDGDREGRRRFKSLLQNADPLVARRLEETRERILKRGYFLSLRFVTTGSVSRGLLAEFQTGSNEMEMIIQDAIKVRRLFGDYLDGAAPPVASVDVVLNSRDTVRWVDRENGIESWVVTATGAEIAKLYGRTGPRVFARNIRGFLGNTEINKGMRYTLKREPEKFWYYNNGITIVCDEATRIQERGKDLLRIENPQIINGQQTTRMLAENPSTRASVLMRVTAFARESSEGGEVFGQMVENVVAATNRQNRISAADLRSNDGEQVRLEREMLKRGYLYVRKRQARAQARANAPQKTWWTCSKEQMAQALGACFLDPYEVRLGRENLFGVDNYPRLFGGRPVPTYLAAFWLRRIVRRQAKGKPERAYAGWLVLHMLWADVGKAFSGARQQEDMIHFLERESWDGRGVRAISRSLDQLFRSALRFYRRYRGTGEEAKDISTFFKAKGLQNKFASFWERRSNQSHGRYRRDIERFVAAVNSFAEEIVG